MYFQPFELYIFKVCHLTGINDFCRKFTSLANVKKFNQSFVSLAYFASVNKQANLANFIRLDHFIHIKYVFCLLQVPQQN
jgi:hypothetical protein